MPQDPNRQITLEEFEEQRRQYYGLPKGLTESLKTQESGGQQYDPKTGGVLTSPKRAKGRFQVLQSTADQFQLNADDPFENTEAAFRYLSDLQKKVDAKVTDPGERWASALNGYHAGEGRLRDVNKTGNLTTGSDGGIRTADYVNSIMKRWQQYDSQAPAQPKPADTQLRFDLSGGGRQPKPLPSPSAQQKFQLEKEIIDPMIRAGATREQIAAERKKIDARLRIPTKQDDFDPREDVFTSARRGAERSAAMVGPAPTETPGPMRDFLNRIGRGVTRTVGNTVTGLASLPEPYDEGAMYRDVMLNAMGQPMTPASNYKTDPRAVAEAERKISQPIRAAGERAFPIDPSVQPSYNPLKSGFYRATLPEAIGSMGIPVVGGLLAGPAAPLFSAASGAMQNAGNTFSEAKAAGASDEDALAASRIGAAIGTTEAFGIGRLLAKAGVARPALKRLGEIIEEYGQEAGAAWLDNLNAAVFSGYDPSKPTSFFDPSVQGPGFVGALLGGGVQGLDVAGQRIARGRTQAAPVQPTTAPLTDPLTTPPAEPTAQPGGLAAVLENLRANTPEGKREAAEKQKALEAEQKTAQAEQDRLNLFSEAQTMAAEAAERAQAFIDAGDLQSAANELLSQQDALREQLGQVPRTSLRERDAINRQIRSLGDQVKDIAQQAKEAAKAKPATPAVPQQTETLEYPAQNVQPTRGFEDAPSTAFIPPPAIGAAVPAPSAPQPDTGRRLIERTRERAEALIAEGRFDEAIAELKANQQALRDAKAQAKKKPGARVVFERQTGQAGNRIGEVRKMKAEAEKQRKRVESAPTADIPQSSILNPQSSPLLGSLVNPEGGIPQAPEGASGKFGALARQQAAEAEAAPQGRRKDTGLLSPVEYLKRKTGGQGIRVSDRGEAAVLGAKEAGIVGLTNRKSKWTANDAAVMLDEGGFVMPDGRAFTDPSVRESDVLEFLGAFGKEGRLNTEALGRQLADEEAEYYAGLEEAEPLAQTVESAQDVQSNLEGSQNEPSQVALIRRPRTERLPVPRATDENIESLRNRREELSRLRYDRRGELPQDLADESRELGAVIKEYENAQERASRGGRLEDAPPRWMQDRPGAPAAGDGIRQAMAQAEARLDQEIGRGVEVLPKDDSEILERGVRALDQLFEDTDARELLDAAARGDNDARQQFTEWADQGYGIDRDTAESLVDVRSAPRERERTVARSAGVETGNEAGSSRPGQDRQTVAAGATSREFSQRDIDLLNQDASALSSEFLDPYLKSLEDLRNQRLRGDVALPDWALRQLDAKLKQANEVRVQRRKAGELGPKNQPLLAPAKPLSKVEGGRRLVEQAKAREKDKKEEPPTVVHPNPEIDRKPILAETKRGTVIVPNPSNKKGVSEVKDRSDEPSEYSFSSTQVNLPKEIADKILAFGRRIPDRDLADDGRETEPHITVKYGLHGSDAKFAEDALAGENPARVTFGKVSIFENDEYDVVKVDVQSRDLHRLNKKIAESQPVTDTFLDYKPHATIAYVKKGLGKKYAGDTFLEGQTVTLDSVTFSGRDGERVEIPLAAKPKPKVDYRIPEEAMPELRGRPKPQIRQERATPSQIGNTPPIPRQATIRELGDNVRAEYRPAANRAGTVIVNDWAHELFNVMRSIVAPATTRVSGGVNMDSPFVATVSRYIRYEARNNPRLTDSGRTNLNDFARALDSAAADGPSVSISPLWQRPVAAAESKRAAGRRSISPARVEAGRQITEQARTLGTFAGQEFQPVLTTNIGRTKKTIRHEATHFYQSVINPDIYTLTTRGWLDAQPFASDIRAELTRRRYSPDQHTAEAAAFIASGDWGIFGMSNDDARAFLKEYFDDIAFKNSRRAINNFRAVHPALQDLAEAYRDPNQARFGEGPPRRIQPRRPAGPGRGSPEELTRESRVRTSAGIGRGSEGLPGRDAGRVSRESGESALDRAVADSPTDDTKVKVADLGLGSKFPPSRPANAVAVKKNIPINDITLGRDDLSRGRMNQVQEALKGGVQPEKKGVRLANQIDPIVVVPDPKQPGKWIVSDDGNHRIALLKLQGFEGDVPVTAWEAPDYASREAVISSMTPGERAFLERLQDPEQASIVRGEIRQGLREAGSSIRIPMDRTEPKRIEEGRIEARVSDLEASQRRVGAENVRGYSVAVINGSRLRTISKKTRQEAMRAANVAIDRGAEKAEIWEDRRDGESYQVDTVTPNSRSAAESRRNLARRFIEDEGGSASLGLGVGNVGRKLAAPKAPQSTVPLPADWDMEKWSEKVFNELSKLLADGKISKRKEKQFEKAITDVLTAANERDGARMFLARENLAKLTGGGFSAADVAGAPRSIMAGGDLSFILRQGGAYNLPGLFLSPKETVTRVLKAAAAMKEGNYARANAQIAAMPRAKEMRESGLHLSNQRKIEGDNKLTDREENYLSRFLQDVPWYKQTERGNTTMLDMLRADKFNKYASYLEKKGITFDSNPRAYKQMARFINLMTGRGGFGESGGTFDQAIPFLSLGIFSPRWVASRIQLLGLMPKLVKDAAADRLRPDPKADRIDPAVRKLMWKDLGAYAGAVGVTLGLLAAAGAAGLADIEVGDDPEDADFGKVIINGKHHYDLSSGLGPYLVLGMRMSKAALKRKNGEQLEEYEQPGAILMRFARSKASPAAGFTANALTGEDFRGRPITVAKSALELVTPLTIDGFMDGYNVEGGKIGGGLMSLPATLGTGYSAYERDKQASGVPGFAKEARNLGVEFNEKFIEGEPVEMAKSRAERRKGLVTKYGPALIQSREFQNADEASKTKMLDSFKRLTDDLANEKSPRISKLAPGAILGAIKTAQKTQETKKRNEQKKLIYAAP